MPKGAFLLPAAGAAVVVGTLGHGLCKGQRLDVSPQNISFVATARASMSLENPPSRSVGLGASPFGAANIHFRLREISPQTLPTGQATNFVVVSPSSGFTPQVTTVALNPRVVPYMPHGFYRLLVTFESPDSGSINSVIVSLRLTRPGPPEIADVVNAATLQPNISPGQMVTIRGGNLSTPPVIAEPDSAGLFPTDIHHTRVTFNGIRAPLLFISNDRIDCVVPQGVSGSTNVEVVVELVLVETEGTQIIDRSLPVSVPISDTSPGIFTADGSGAGPGLIRNTGAGGELNTAENPAPKGTAVTFSATGAGAWNVTYPDGSIVFDARLQLLPPNPPFLAPLAPVTVTIGGQPARVITAIAQRMRVFGTLEVTAEIPEGIESGAQPILLRIGENDNSKQNVTVWVR